MTSLTHWNRENKKHLDKEQRSVSSTTAASVSMGNGPSNITSDLACTADSAAIGFPWRDLIGTVIRKLLGIIAIKSRESLITCYPSISSGTTYIRSTLHSFLVSINYSAGLLLSTTGDLRKNMHYA